MRGRICATWLAVVVHLLGAGCARREGDARDLAVSSDRQAREAVDGALAELARGDEAAVLRRFCDQSREGRALSSSLLAPALRRGDLRVVRVEPAWVGAEPFFFVEIGTADGAWRHGLGVRVRDGCLDRAVGASGPRATERAVIDL